MAQEVNSDILSRMQSGIYKIEHTESGKVYIGSSTEMPYRFKCHKRDMCKGKHFNRYLNHAAQKYGIEAFTFKVLLVCAPEHLTFFEQRAIDAYKASDKRYGYNTRPVADSVKGMTFDRGGYKAGDKYGRLTLIKRLEDKPYKTNWLCRCDCGKEIVVQKTRVRSGAVSSCGCYAKEMLIKNHTTHGGRFKKEYSVWLNMRRRCYEPTNVRYSRYGARGIKVCNAWKSNFERFYADMGDCPEGHILGRRDMNKGYNRNNCYWSTNDEQIRKRRTSHLVVIHGKEYNVRDAEVVLGIHRSSINQRHRQTGETYQQVTEHFLAKMKK